MRDSHRPVTSSVPPYQAPYEWKLAIMLMAAAVLLSAIGALFWLSVGPMIRAQHGAELEREAKVAACVGRGRVVLDVLGDPVCVLDAAIVKGE